MRLFLDMSLADTDTNSLIVTGLAWGQNNIGGNSKRSVMTLTQMMIADVGFVYSATAGMASLLNPLSPFPALL